MQFILLITSDAGVDWLAAGLSEEDAIGTAQDYIKAHPGAVVTMIEAYRLFGILEDGGNVKD